MLDVFYVNRAHNPMYIYNIPSDHHLTVMHPHTLYTAASGNFVIMELRTSTSIQCTARNIAQVQWFNSQNQTLSTSQIPNIEVHGDTLSIVNATTSLNGAQFHCRGEDSNGNVQLWQHYSIIVSGMLLGNPSCRSLPNPYPSYIIIIKDPN